MEVEESKSRETTKEGTLVIAVRTAETITTSLSFLESIAALPEYAM